MSSCATFSLVSLAIVALTMQRSDPSGSVRPKVLHEPIKHIQQDAEQRNVLCALLELHNWKPEVPGWSVTAASCWGRVKTYIYPVLSSSNYQLPNQPRQPVSTAHHVFNYFGTSRSILPGGLFG